MKTFWLLIITAILTFSGNSQTLTATQIIKKANDKMQGKTSYMEMEMQIIRPKWTRTVSFKTCSKGREYSLTLITDPAKEKGQTFLKRQNEMWTWNPKINRLIKLPPSMMSQGWMGSDYTNDDILKESSIVNDYTHKIIGTETVSGRECWKIEMTPKENAAVIWGKVIKWIDKKDFLQLKSMYYDEDDELIKTEAGSEIKMMGGRMLPSKLEIVPADNPKKKTVVFLKTVIFDIAIDSNFFSQQNMKKGINLAFPKK
ncbi:MAG: outer membrane lipoprotein-sorting protein [Candidatus Zixiibacteriota bacterium]|nr:MAG: outer membrane lipoprotein-sorting protein [candidate division Zixibacteria bacterium]